MKEEVLQENQVSEVQENNEQATVETTESKPTKVEKRTVRSQVDSKPSNKKFDRNKIN